MSAVESHLHEHAKEQLVAAKVAQVTPPVAVSGAHILGYPIADAVLWLTALYLCLQIGYLSWKWGSEWRAKGKRKTKR